MMNKISVFTILMLFGLIGFSYPQIKVIQESDMKIKKTFEELAEKGINSVTIYRYDVDSGVVSTEADKLSKTIINLSNNTLTEITFSPSYSKSVAKFNDSKNISELSLYYSDNSLMSKVKTEYDKDNKIKDKIYYFGNSMTFKTENVYSSGNIVKQIYMDSLGKKLNYSSMFYDNSDRLIEEDKFNSKDSIEIIYHYMYDDAGRCTEETITYPEANYMSKNEYKYNSNGNKTDAVFYGMGGKITSKSKFKYNNVGLMTEETSYSIDDNLIWKNEYKYDDKGNKLEWKYTDFIEGMDYLYKVVYDEN
jgi:hypothetical protein